MSGRIILTSCGRLVSLNRSKCISTTRYFHCNRQISAAPAFQYTRVTQICSRNILQSNSLKLNIAGSFHLCAQFNKHKDKGKPKKSHKLEVFIRPEDAEEFVDLNFIHDEMLKIIEKLKHDYVQQFRIGANLQLLDNIKVSLQGDDFQLREVATITKKSPKLLQLDFVNFPEALSSAQTAIECSGMNLNPTVKGTKLEIPVPVVTAEHRKTLAKGAKARMNEAKDETRKILKYHEKKISKIEHLPENTGIVIKKQIHAYADANLKEAENIFKAKEKDLLLKE